MVVEGELDASVNGLIPGAVIQPEVAMVVELDPEGRVPLAPGSRTRYPAEGAQPLRVVDPQLFRQIIVPTISTQSPDESVYEWTDDLTPESPQVRMARTLMPVSPMELEVYETYFTSARLRTAEGWSDWIGEIRVLYGQDGRRGYYYGVVTVSAPRYGGLGYVGYPVSVGLAEDRIHAHELGHNMNLQHAPCGGVLDADIDYPYGNGGIGIWGYDIHQDRLLDPADYRDVMGYCSLNWISDYHFGRATAHRLDGDGGVVLGGSGPGSDGRERGGMLVVWGSVEDGRAQLEPAFVLDGPPVLPETDGPYRVDGLGPDGRTEFSLSFTPTPLEFGGGGFVFFVPWEDDWAGSLDRIVLSGPEGEYILTRSGEPPLAVVTDPSTGRIQAIVRDWEGDSLPGEGTANVTITRGIPGGAVAGANRRSRPAALRDIQEENGHGVGDAEGAREGAPEGHLRDRDVRDVRDRRACTGMVRELVVERPAGLNAVREREPLTYWVRRRRIHLIGQPGFTLESTLRIRWIQIERGDGR